VENNADIKLLMKIQLLTILYHRLGGFSLAQLQYSGSHWLISILALYILCQQWKHDKCLLLLGENKEGPTNKRAALSKTAKFIVAIQTTVSTENKTISA
jgi:hypothetical protein